MPNRAYAFSFWNPFSTTADAAIISSSIPSSATPTLRATLNSNTHSSAPIALATSGDSALVSYNGPDGTLADVASSTPSDRISVYVVRPGDTLSEIADMFGVSANTIIWANNLIGIRDVHVGDTLVILPVSGIEYKIVKGDKLSTLAKKYGADSDEIAQYNGLDPNAPLEVGSTIIIPGGEAPVAPVIKKTSAQNIGPEPYLGGSGPVQTGYYSNPVPGARISQGLHGHNAVDFAAKRGTPIHASADGIVIVARNGGWNGGYGNYVVVTHSNGTQTLYAHMTNAIVTPGQTVYSGQVIGYVGNTGKSTGSHLHFEIRGAANPFAN